MSEKRASHNLRGGSTVALADARDALDVENFEPTGDIEETDNGRQIVISRELPQSPQVVWGYLANAARISRWFGHCHTLGDASRMTMVSEEIESSYDVTIAESTPYTYLHLAVNDHQATISTSASTSLRKTTMRPTWNSTTAWKALKNRSVLSPQSGN